jgi:four helix bundle protein
MRDHRTLRTFILADSLILSIYRATSRFPTEERYGLQAQIRRAAVSVAANLVEGCARRSHREYLQFLLIAFGSAAETCYLVDVCRRLDFFDGTTGASLHAEYDHLVRMLRRQVEAVEVKAPASPSRPR